jgi:hypothetical protein
MIMNKPGSRNLFDVPAPAALPAEAAEIIELWKTLMARGDGLHFMGQPGSHSVWLVVDEPEDNTKANSSSRGASGA